MTEMNLYPPELRYNPEHTWLKVEEGRRGRVGITFYAQQQLKEVVFIELPEVGREVTQMQPFGVIESAKATNDLYSPVSGRVIEVNERLVDDPGTVNRDPYGDGWMIVVEMPASEVPTTLMTADEYRRFVGGR